MTEAVSAPGTHRGRRGWEVYTGRSRPRSAAVTSPSGPHPCSRPAGSTLSGVRVLSPRPAVAAVAGALSRAAAAVERATGAAVAAEATPVPTSGQALRRRGHGWCLQRRCVHGGQPATPPRRSYLNQPTISKMVHATALKVVRSSAKMKRGLPAFPPVERLSQTALSTTAPHSNRRSFGSGPKRGLFSWQQPRTHDHPLLSWWRRESGEQARQQECAEEPEHERHHRVAPARMGRWLDRLRCAATTSRHPDVSTS